MNNRNTPPQLIIWWILWAAFQVEIFVIYYFLGATGAQPPASTSDSSIWMAGAAPFAISAIIRWLILPRARNAQAALILFILGIAVAEMSCFLGLFIFPAHKQTLMILSAFGIFQFIPIFASRYFAGDR